MDEKQIIPQKVINLSATFLETHKKTNFKVFADLRSRRFVLILENKVAIVTGGGYGIGRGSCIEFAREGAKVAIVDWNEKTGNETLQLLNKEAKNDGEESAIFLKADVSKIPDIEEAVAQTVRKFGKLDILYSNAGVNCFKSTFDTDENDWLRLVDINLKGSFFFAKIAARQMVDQKSGGSLLFTSSISGVSGEDDQVAYSATKGGIIAMVTAMAKDLGRYSIRVNCILPGNVDTAQFRGWMSSKPDYEKAMAEAVDNGIIKRLGVPQDIGRAAAFLVSDKADWITGIAMPVDGGYLVRH